MEQTGKEKQVLIEQQATNSDKERNVQNSNLPSKEIEKQVDQQSKTLQSMSAKLGKDSSIRIKEDSVEQSKDNYKESQDEPSVQYKLNLENTKSKPKEEIINAIRTERYRQDDLPISANYDYWSTKHSKSIEVKKYMKHFHQKDKKIKQELRFKKLAIQQAKRRKAQQAQRQHSLLESYNKQLIRDRAEARIHALKQQQQTRISREKQFKQFFKDFKKTEPLHVKMQQSYRQHVELPRLQQRRPKLRNPTLEQIAEHARKHDEEVAQLSRSPVLYNEPISVYKSKFYPSAQKQDGQKSDGVRQMVQKRNNYAKMVKEVFKPEISQRLVQEMEQRLQREKLRGPRSRQSQKKSQQDDDQDQQISEEQDSDDEEDQYTQEIEPEQQPHCAYLNKIGNEYLEYVKKLKKKPKLTKQQRIRLAEQLEQQERGKYRQKVVKINYLDELKMQRSQSPPYKNPFTNWESDLKNPKLNSLDKKKRIFLKSQQIAQSADRKYQELDNSNLNASQLLSERQKIDNQYLDAIKAKLAAMRV